MTGFIIEAVFLFAGALYILLLWIWVGRRRRLRHGAAATIGDIRKRCQVNRTAGLGGYFEHTTLKVKAPVWQTQITPFSGRESVFYIVEISQMYQTAGVKKSGQHNKGLFITKECAVACRQSAACLVVQDMDAADTAIVDYPEKSIGKNDFTMLESNIPVHEMAQHAWWKTLQYHPVGLRTLGFHVTEKLITPGQVFLVTGKAHLRGDKLHIE